MFAANKKVLKQKKQNKKPSEEIFSWIKVLYNDFTCRTKSFKHECDVCFFVVCM